MRGRAFVVTGLLLILAAGFCLRVDSLSNWLNQKERYFFADQKIPLMLTVDSYYYLEIARQLQEGTFSEYDKRRNVPIGYKQPSPPPLLSVLLARLSRITGASLEWVALFIPACLGVLLAIPVYLLTYTLTIEAGGKVFDKPLLHGSARVAGLAAALLALLSPLFLGRSGIGWCDTDALNVTFPVLLAYLAIRCADAESLKGQVVCLVGFVISTLLFLWWWDQSHVPVFAFAAIPFLVALIFVGIRSPGRLFPVVLFGALLVFVVGWWKGFGVLNPLNYLETLKGMTKYIVSEVGDSPFRAAGAAVSEQSQTSLKLLIRESSGGWPGFLLACCGLLALVWLCKGYVLYLTPLLIVSILSLKGQRFLIFTAPLFGVGVGTLCFFACYWVRKPAWRTGILALLLVLSSWSAVQTGLAYGKRVPRRAPVLFEAMKQINEKTEKDAVVWASWGHGHPLLYYGQRGVVADGVFHSAELQYVLSFPLATDDFRLAANWISFYVANGSQGLRRVNELFGDGANDWVQGMAALQDILKTGVQKSRRLLQEKYKLSKSDIEKEMNWLFPGNSRPIYLVLDYLLLDQAWFTLGRWDLKSRTGPQKYIFFPIQNVTGNDDGRIEGMVQQGKVTIDVKTGGLQAGRGTNTLEILKVHDGKTMHVTRYDNGSGVYAEFFLPGRMGVLSDKQTVNTLLVKLYYEYTYDRRFFSPIDVGNPYCAIWKVFGEGGRRASSQGL